MGVDVVWSCSLWVQMWCGVVHCGCRCGVELQLYTTDIAFHGWVMALQSTRASMRLS